VGAVPDFDDQDVPVLVALTATKIILPLTHNLVVGKRIGVQHLAKLRTKEEERFLRTNRGEEAVSLRKPTPEERFLTSAGRRFRGSESGRKSQPAPFEMTGGRGRAGNVRRDRLTVPTGSVSPLHNCGGASIPQLHPGCKVRI